MDDSESLSHSKWECKFHVIFIPKCRRKTLYEQLRPHLGEVFKKLVQYKESRIEEGHLMPDHVHMLISIPPKYSVSQVIGYIKGKSAIHLARVYGERKRNFVGQHFGNSCQLHSGQTLCWQLYKQGLMVVNGTALLTKYRALKRWHWAGLRSNGTPGQLELIV
jgi:putative transposase